MSPPVEAVANYAPVSPNPVDALLEYPYRRPQSSFWTDGNTVTPLPNDSMSFAEQSNALLEEYGLPLVEERIPVAAFGTNANPHRLRATRMFYEGAEIFCAYNAR